MNKWLALLILSAFLLGCGGITVTPVTDATYTEGIRYYAPQPYLLVTSTSQQIAWLPNPQESYVIKQKWGIGKTTVSVTLNNGWQLSSLGTVRDTDIPATIAAFGTVAGNVGKFMLVKEGGEQQPLPVGLYPLNWVSGIPGHWEIKK